MIESYFIFILLVRLRVLLSEALMTTSYGEITNDFELNGVSGFDLKRIQKEIQENNQMTYWMQD